MRRDVGRRLSPPLPRGEGLGVRVRVAALRLSLVRAQSPSPQPSPPGRGSRTVWRCSIAVILALLSVIGLPAHAGAQAEEKLSASVQTALASAIADRSAPKLIGDPKEVQPWLAEMSSRLAKRMPDAEQRTEFLITVQYEASRAGLDPQLMLALINHESAFRKYAISSASARGYTQVMPFWVKLIGTTEHNLFHLRTNLRYGCVILRHYLDIEKGDVVRALARYNGSLGKFEYPNTVLGLQENRWKWTPVKPTP
jgi:soluble lytic murein transglycosylase-like protein